MLVRESSNQIPGAVSFAPDVGRHSHRWVALVHELSNQSPSVVRGILKVRLKCVLDKSIDIGAIGLDWLKYTFALSVLNDVTSAGAELFIADSTICISWPDWASQEGKQNLRHHLSVLRDEGNGFRLTEAATRGLRTLPKNLSSESLFVAVEQGEFILHAAKEIHSENVTYEDIFAAAVRSWSMPYRDREGRRSRFVLTLTHPRIGTNVPAGILEVCDGPPFHPLRDSCLGVTSETLNDWIRSQDTSRVGALLADRFTRIYCAMRGSKRRSLEALYGDILKFERMSAGRSTGHLQIRRAKSIAYAARLARAHRAAIQLKAGIRPQSTDLSAIARVCRDLVLPRVCLEVSICGAFPPFSEALVGKLVASFMADPRIRNLCRRPAGQILRDIFNTDKLAEEMPRSGALLLTTQGLYANHSAQYQDVFVPGRQGKFVKLEKIGLTGGATASLMSRQTDQLATKLLDQCERRLVSNEYGSGGSKRQRRIEAAITKIGMTRETIHPIINRPYYGIALANNLPNVVLLNEKPHPLVEIKASPSQYCRDAVEAWRREWLPRAYQRLQRKWGTREIAGVAGIIGGNIERPT
jgi:hypothetical protein